MRKIYVALLCCVLAVGLSGCSGDKSEEVSSSLYSQQYDSAWPWTVSDVTIHCKDAGAFTFDADGTEYFGNGLAKGRGYGSDPRPIWKDDAEFSGLKVSTDDFIAMANNFCGFRH